MINASPVR